MYNMYKTKERTLRSLLINSTKTHAKKTALGMINGSLVITYKSLGLLATRFANLLHNMGAKEGSKVVLLSENRPEWGITYIGTTAAGFVIVPVLPDFHQDQIANIIEHSEADFVVVSDKYLSKLPNKMSAKVINISEIASVEAFIEIKKYSINNIEEYFPKIPESTLASIIYTSGSTGTPKGVMLSHKNLVSNFISTENIIHLRPNDKLLSILPLAHTYECTIGFLCGFAQGCSAWYLDRPASASVLIPALKKLRPSIMLSVPLIIEKIYKASILPSLNKISLWKYKKLRPLLEYVAGIKLKKTFGGKIRFFGIGGSAIAPDVESFLLHAHFPYATGYGLTETSPLIAAAKPHKTCHRSAGKRLIDVELRISDIKPETGEGEIQAKGPNIMMGYYKNPELSEKAFTSDGWFKTGDLGIFDNKGRLFIKGRVKTMILGAAGENIYPEEIEAVIKEEQIVEEALVIKDRGGLTALIQLKDDVIKKLEIAAKGSRDVFDKLVKDSLEALRREVNNSLSSFNRISKVVLQTCPFEKTPTMKIKRFLYTNAMA